MVSGVTKYSFFCCKNKTSHVVVGQLVIPRSESDEESCEIPRYARNDKLKLTQ